MVRALASSPPRPGRSSDGAPTLQVCPPFTQRASVDRETVVRTAKTAASRSITISTLDESLGPENPVKFGGSVAYRQKIHITDGDIGKLNTDRSSATPAFAAATGSRSLKRQRLQCRSIQDRYRSVQPAPSAPSTACMHLAIQRVNPPQHQSTHGDFDALCEYKADRRRIFTGAKTRARQGHHRCHGQARRIRSLSRGRLGSY